MTDRAERLLPATKTARLFVVAVLAAAFLLRAGTVLADRGYEPVNDASNYDGIATSIANGDGYGRTHIPPAEGPSAFRAPAYPATLAVVYKVFGDHRYTAGRLANQLIGTALVAMIGLLAAQLLGQRAGAIALVLAAIHPTLMLYGTSLQLEPLLATLELAAIAAALQYRRTGATGWRWPIVIGLCVGAAILTREIGIWLVPPTVLLVWTGRPRWSRAALVTPLLVVAVAAAVVLPWTYRNYRTFDTFIPVTTTAGYGLAGTYNDTAMNDSRYPAVWTPPALDPILREKLLALDHPNEVELDRTLREAALDYIRDNPSSVVKAGFWNTVRLFDLEGPGHALFLAPFLPYDKTLLRIAVYTSYLVYGLAIVGFATGSLRKVPKVLWLFPVLVWWNLAVLSGNIRYRASIEPFLVIAAAAAIMWAFDRWGPGRLTARLGGDARDEAR